jgi:hypothetical protein
MTPFLIAIDSALNIKWYKAFEHSLSNIDITDMVKINDTLIAVSGGHSNSNNASQCQSSNCSWFGLFNVKTQNFVWAKYRNVNNLHHESLTGIDFDGNNIIVVGQGTSTGKGGVVLKSDLNGNILWQRELSWGGNEFSPMDVIVDNGNYVVLVWRSDCIILKLDGNGNLLWYSFYDSGNHDHCYAMIKDVDGYVVAGFTCEGWDCSSTLGNDNILVFKTDFNGNIIWSKLYSSSVAGWYSEDRAYNIAFDYDGNYLVSGFVRKDSLTSYPIVLKINRTNGNLIWARYWDTPPQNTNSNEAKGVISIGQGKFYLLTFIGSGTDASGGFAIIREDTNPNLAGHCTEPIQFTVNNVVLTNNPPFGPSINSASYNWNGFNLTSYSLNIGITNSCQITPISNYEYIKSCDYEIRSQRNYIEINLMRKKRVYIYDVLGKVVYRDEFEGKRRIKLKDGVYIIRLDNEKFKILVK